MISSLMKGLRKGGNLYWDKPSSRHCDHYLWMLMQSYSAIPKKIKRTGQGYLCLVSKIQGGSENGTQQKQCVDG